MEEGTSSSRSTSLKRCFLFRNGGHPGEGKVLLVPEDMQWKDFLAKVAEKLGLGSSGDESRKVWLASKGVLLESVAEFEEGDTLCIAINPEDTFHPLPTTMVPPKRRLLEGILRHNNEPRFVFLTHHKLSWTPQALGHQLIEVHLAHVAGVTNSLKQPNAFVIHAYPIVELKSRQRSVKHIEFVAPDKETQIKWINAIREALNPPKRLLVLVNPFGGKGTAAKIWKQVHPLFIVANIKLDVIETKHAGHAVEIMGRVDPDEYEGVVVVSGDGLLNEVVNGLMSRPDWQYAISKLTLGIVPGGSGNGLAVAIGCPSALQAAFAIIKGGTRPLDAFSVVQEGRPRKFGFLHVAWGFISDVDFDSETYRWMGGIRFTVTAVEKLVTGTPYRGKISYIAGTPLTKQPCVSGCSICCPHQLLYDKVVKAQPVESEKGEVEVGGPPLLYIGENSKGEEEWQHVEDTFSLLSCANTPAISTDMFLTPYAHLSDGLLDLCFIRSTGKGNMAQILTGAADASHVKNPAFENIKVKAVVIEPFEGKGKCGVDGELLPSTTIKMEVHPALLRLYHPHPFL